MRCVTLGLAACFGLLGLVRGAEARVAIHVDLSSQTMHVSSESGDYVWPISSARLGYVTPRGTFGIQRMEAMHRSHKYNNAPMPHSLFFSGGYAIHGSYEVAALGEPASHGCIRLSPAHAAALYRMVGSEGGTISITGTAPERAVRYARADVDRTYPQAVRRRYYAPPNAGTPVYPGYGYDVPSGYAPDYGQGFYLGMGDYPGE